MIKPIRNDQDLKDSVARVSELFGCPLGSVESDESEVLMVLVEEYENRMYPMSDPEPIVVIRERLVDLNLTRKDLIGPLGHASVVSEVLSGKRSLTVKMIQKLSELLGIPPQLLLPAKSGVKKTA